MKFARSIVVLPCQSLEDFSLKRDAAESHQLLTAWTLGWHPAVVASIEAIPGWERAASPPDDVHGCLVMVPSCSRHLLPEGWLDRARNEAACFFDDCDDRQRMLAEVLAKLDPPAVEIDAELAADFMALGMAHLVIELLTRQLRYMSNLDESTLQTRVLDAARAVMSGDRETAGHELQRAYDILQEARDYFYPVSGNLVDLTLVAPGTVGAALCDELSGPSPLNLLMNGDTLEELCRYEPETRKALQAAIEARRVSVIGGEYGESPLPLLSIEAIADELRRGRETFAKHLGTPPTIYGRRRYGLLSLMPQVLRKAGFAWGVHFTLDDGRFPTVNQSRMTWEGTDGTHLETIARVPLDARRHDTFFRLPERLGDVLDLDHAATLVFAHWPGETSPWYRELQRIARRSGVLGTFTTLEDYLMVNCSGQTVRHPTDDYRPPYLRQDVSARRRDPISRYVRYHLHRTVLEAEQTLSAWAELFGAKPADDPARADLLREVDDTLAVDREAAGDLDGRVTAAWERQLQRLADALTATRSGPRGCLWFNPFSVMRRQALCSAGEASAAGPVQLAEIPPLGYAWLGAHEASNAESGKAEPPMAEGNVLRNEYFEVALSNSTGAIQSVTTTNVRGNRLGQQLVLRRPDPEPSPEIWSEEPYDPTANQVLMALDEMSITSAGPSVGEIVSRGRLVDRYGQRLAGYQQTTRARRGSRVLELEIELDPEWLPDDDPWNCYYGVRFAWSDSGAEIVRSSGLVHRRTDLKRFEAPHFVDLRSGNVRTTLLTGGLCYHRRHEDRMLDTLLICAGESCRSFRLGVGFDLPAPAAAALEYLAPPPVVASAVAPDPATQRCFRLDARHVVPTRWEPVWEANQVVGFRVRLLETEGRDATVALEAYRPVASARRLDVEEELSALTIDAGRLMIPLRACEWTWIECRWESSQEEGVRS